MTPEKFISDIREQIINRGLNHYAESLDSTTVSKDEAWQLALDLYHQLPFEKRKVFLSFIKTIMVNSVSHVLGILDSTSYINEDRDEVDVFDKKTNERLNDYLQDIFLEKEEL